MELAGRTALITGASSGIGAEFAEALGRRKVQLVLLARSGDALEERATGLRSRHGVSVAVIPCDLSRPDAIELVTGRLAELGLTVDILVNNAGFGTFGDFDTIPEGHDHQQVLVNVLAVVDLTRALLPGMVARGHGAVVNVSSMAAFQPMPYVAVYGASKAFLFSFSQALAGELRGRGVEVVTLCPGPVETPFMDVIGTRAHAMGQEVSRSDVVSAAIGALTAGRRAPVIPGRLNLVLSRLTGLVPRRLTLAVMEVSIRRSAAGLGTPLRGPADVPAGERVHS